MRTKVTKTKKSRNKRQGKGARCKATERQEEMRTTVTKTEA